MVKFGSDNDTATSSKPLITTSKTMSKPKPQVHAKKTPKKPIRKVSKYRGLSPKHMKVIACLGANAECSIKEIIDYIGGYANNQVQTLLRLGHIGRYKQYGNTKYTWIYFLE